MRGFIYTIVAVFTLVISLGCIFNGERDGKWKQTYYGMRGGILTYEYEMHQGDATFFKTISKSAPSSNMQWTITTISKETDDVTITETETSMAGNVEIQRDTLYKK